MPIYLFENKGEIREIFFKMNDNKQYFDENGIEWKRIFLKPQMSVDVSWNEDSSKDFAQKSGIKKGTIGNLEDKAKELSLKREKKYGRDPVKEKMYKDYAKTRGGKMHPNQKREIFEKKKKKFSKLGFDVSL